MNLFSEFSVVEMAKVMMTTRPKVVKLPPIAEKARLNLIGEFVFENSVYLPLEYGRKFDIQKGHGSSRIRFMYYYLCHRRDRDKNTRIKDLTSKILYFIILIFKF